MSRARSWGPLLVIAVVVGALFATGVFPSPFRRAETAAAPLTGGARSTTAPPGRVTWGAYVDGADKEPAKFAALEQQTGRLGMASIFRGKGDTWPYPVDHTLGRGRTLLVSWSLEDWGNYRWWSSGAGDTVLKQQAARLKNYDGALAIRPWAEMNADWQAFQPTVDGKQPRGGTPAEFKQAWRHVVTLMRAHGVKATWIFNPTTDVYAASTDVRSIYPGADVVDAVGLDGYNWGTAAGDARHRWASFADIFAPQYARLQQAAGDKPVWICEVGSADTAHPRVSGQPVTGGSKAQWLTGLRDSLPRQFPAVTHVAFFHADKERDWRLDSTPAVLQAAKDVVATR
ncbi:glycoside hydrolase family 26 protein [Calidifontibacter indicus]|uniref:Glycosyl hydrolase family 26 n=1 Tax=Calidifontibacter indicus TaxID=419650 RepID=A0A3D9UNG7_9MICO|nr:glycosyl hydrolase [Calidifontibacter indicus]REF30836.1 glycosyl hydrolase family 26 [Calidifontibacter indicus]